MDRHPPKNVEEADERMASASDNNGTSVTRRLREGRFPSPPAGEEDFLVLRGLRVMVADPSEAPPQLETDESYTLEVGAASVCANSFLP